MLDLAIEAVLTSGGLDKLDLYACLGVREVWFWFASGVEAYALEDGAYRRICSSVVLPGLELSLIDRFAQADDVYEAVVEFRRVIRATDEP